MTVLEALTAETGVAPTPRQTENARLYGGWDDPETIASIPRQVYTMRRNLLWTFGIVASEADVSSEIDVRGWDDHAHNGSWLTGSAAARLAQRLRHETDPYRLITARLYDRAFARMPDEEGLRGWTTEAQAMFERHLVPGFLLGAQGEDRARAEALLAERRGTP